jgi:hypothetical protein
MRFRLERRVAHFFISGRSLCIQNGTTIALHSRCVIPDDWETIHRPFLSMHTYAQLVGCSVTASAISPDYQRKQPIVLRVCTRWAVVTGRVHPVQISCLAGPI